MKHQDITITCRIDGTDQTEQRTATIAYCYATEIAFKDLTDRDITDFMQEAVAAIQDNRMPDVKSAVYAIIASMLAYYNSRGEEPPVKDTDLMNEATPMEIGTALGTIIALRSEFYRIPSGEPKDTAVSEASTSKKRKGKGKN